MRVLLTIFCLLIGSAAAGERTVQQLADEKLESANASFDAEDYADARSSYLDLAYLGHKYAMYRLAVMHEYGLGVESRMIDAWAWASLAAENGTASSLVNYASHLWSRLSVEEQVSAKLHRKELAKTYSDAAVVVRLDRKLEQHLKGIVGSRVGAGAASVTIYDPKTGTVTDASKLRREISSTREKLADYASRYGTVELREVESEELATPSNAPVTEK